MDDEKSISCLQELPRRNQLAKPVYSEFVENHGVYLSVTTTPARLYRLPKVFKTLDLTMVKRVYLALPKDRSYGVIPQELLDIPKLEILEPEHDMGCITKLLPALERLGSFDPQAVLITIDDDVGYSPNLPSELAYASLKHQAVAAGHGLPAEFFGLKRFKNWPFSKRAGVDFLEGVSAVAYQPRFFSPLAIESMKRWIAENEDCRASDDFMINYILEKNKIKKVTVRNPFIPEHVPFSYGFGDDALHKKKDNSLKYQACANYIMANGG